MKILYLFLVYRSPETVGRIISRLDENAEFMIHVDANSNDDFSALTSRPNVHFTSKRYATRWGSPELAFAALEGLRESLSLDWDYVCLLSESDYPVKSAEYISDYLSKSGKDHIMVNKLPCDDPLGNGLSNWLEGGRRRTDCYALRLSDKEIATIEPRRIDSGNIRQLIKVLLKGPSKLGEALKMLATYPARKSPVSQYCGGHQWFILRRTTVEKIISFCDSHPDFIRDSRNTQCLDEVFFPTIVNEVIPAEEISHDILRYISWRNDGSSSPADIAASDSETINRCVSDPDTLFMRKATDPALFDAVDSAMGI